MTLLRVLFVKRGFSKDLTIIFRKSSARNGVWVRVPPSPPYHLHPIEERQERNFTILSFFEPRLKQICRLHDHRPDYIDSISINRDPMAPQSAIDATLSYTIYGRGGDNDYTDSFGFKLELLLCSDEEFKVHISRMDRERTLKKKQDEEKRLRQQLETLQREIDNIKAKLGP